MSQTLDTLEILKSYARARGVDADLVDRVATNVSDEHSIPLRIYGTDANPLSETREVFNLHAIEIKNMKGTRSMRLEIKPGSTLLYGGNDTGKTTLLLAILFALFGARAVDVEKAEDLITVGAGEMYVVLEFFGGRVERGVTRRVIKKGANAGETKVEHHLSVEIGGDKANRAQEAQALIDGWLGVDAKFVRRVMCLEQGHLTDILDAEPRVRRDTFYRMLAIDGERTRESLARVLQGHDDFLVHRAQSREQHQAQLESLRRRLSLYPVTQLEQQRAQAAASAGSEQAGRERINGARAALERRLVDLATTRKADNDRRELKAKLDEIKANPIWAAAIEPRDALALRAAECQNATNGLMRSTSDVDARLRQVNEHGMRVKNLPPTCSTCAEIGKVCELTPESKEATLVEIRKQYTAASVELADLRKKKIEAGEREAAALAALSEFDKTESKRKFLAEQMQLLNEAVDRLPVEINTDAVVADVEVKRQELAALEQQGTSAAAADLQVLDKALADARALQAQIEIVERTIRDTEAKQPMARDELEALRWIVTAFAKDGIPLWLAQQHVGRVNEIAKGMRDVDRFHFSFDQDLQVRVDSGDINISPKLASGSARERGAVVLMAALGRYLQELIGLHIPLLWVDELPFQDPSNQQLTVSIVRALTRWYPKVVFASSDWDDLLGQFDNEIGLQPEAVAAELARQRDARAALAAEGQGVLSTPPPPVTRYDDHQAHVDAAAEFDRKTSIANALTEAEKLQRAFDPTPPVSAAEIRYISLCDAHEAVEPQPFARIQGGCARCARGEPVPEPLVEVRETWEGGQLTNVSVDPEHTPEW